MVVVGDNFTRLVIWAFLGTFVALGLMGLICWWLSRRLARTIAQAARTIDDIEAVGPGHHQVEEPLDEEAVPISTSVRHLRQRLDSRIEQLEQDRQQLRTILSGMVEGVVALDADQRILYANDRAALLLELPSRLTVGRRFWEVVRQRALLDLVRRAIEKPEPTREEIAWNGAVRSLTVHAARLPGEPTRGAVLVVHDTTELRRLENLRQEFVANVSHELKTPLSVIKICVETLLDGAVEDPVHRGQFLDRINQQSDRLHNLILDLLSLARIEAGKEMFDFQAVPLAPMVERCFQRFQDRAEARRQVLSATNGESSGAVSVWADEEALDQILDNLVDNALKYTPEGGRIAVRWREEGDEVQLEVTDTGIGIPEHDLPRIFERFYRVDKARARELGGTGLGLSIVKHLVQGMHGNIRASSRVGEGTTFMVTLGRP